MLVRKYAPSIDEVLVWAEEARVRFDELQDDSGRIESLDAEVARAGGRAPEAGRGHQQGAQEGRQEALGQGQRRAEGPGHARRHTGH